MIIVRNRQSNEDKTDNRRATTAKKRRGDGANRTRHWLG